MLAESASAREAATRALLVFAESRWGWGTSEWEDCEDAVDVVISALGIAGLPTTEGSR